jgi:large subunit ribosomal protein L29
MATLELQKLSKEELESQLASNEQQYQSLQYQHAIAPIQNPSQIRLLRRTIARLKTELRAREIALLEKEGNLKRDKIRARRRKAH